jgi:hypothetical protein
VTSKASDAAAAGTLRDARCVDRGGGNWLFTGTLNNTAQTRLTVTIAVALTASAGALVVGHSSYSEALDPGEHRDVSLPVSAEGTAAAECSFVASQEVVP